MDVATDRLGVLVEQFDTAVGFARDRLDGLTDDEYLWEPAGGMWSVRPVGAAASPRPWGPGAYRIDHDRLEPGDVPPLTTIAWRLAHVTSGLAGRWEYTFGPREQDPRAVVDFAPNAAGALALLDEWTARWHDGIVTLTDEQLDTAYGTYPLGLDPDTAFIGILWWVNREVVHHLAEVALLRDLHRAMGAATAAPTRRG